jgi:hypothetical protein
MIITETKNIEDIAKGLKKAGAKNIFLFGCNSCAEQCKTGGETELDNMQEALESKGFKVTGKTLPDYTCYNQIIKKDFRSNDAIEASDALLVLACGAGVKTVADNAASSKKSQAVLPALDSYFLATAERVGRFFEGCSLCGECVLDKTAGICPHTECPKGLLNGPCGGVDNNKCEVIPENDCAWIRIYSRLKAQNRLKLMKTFSKPKDHSRSIKPRSRLLR